MRLYHKHGILRLGRYQSDHTTGRMPETDYRIRDVTICSNGRLVRKVI